MSTRSRDEFNSPSDAVFALLGEQQRREPHADLRMEALRRALQATVDDPRPTLPTDQVWQRLRQQRDAARSEPAVWPPRRRLDRASLTIGDTVWCGERQWRCTDVGTRTLTAIRIDAVELRGTDPASCRVLTQAEATAEGWFNGLPYAVAEVVFDEDDLDGCSLDPQPGAPVVDPS